MSFGLAKSSHGSQIDWGNPITMGLTAAFRFTEGGGTKVYDIARRRYDGSFLNTPSWSTGPRGKAVALSGTAQIQLANIPTPATPNGASIVVLLKCTSSSNLGVVTIGDGTGSGYWGIGINALAPYMYVSGGGAAPTGAAVASGQWVHVVGTFRDSQRIIYQNGLLVASSVAGWTPSTPSSRADIGAFGTGQQLQGAVDHVYIFARELTRADVAALYAHPDLILYRPRKFFSAPNVVADLHAAASITFDAMTVSGTASKIDPLTSSASIIFDAMTVSGTASKIDPVRASASITFGDMTVAGTATSVLHLNASLNFDDMTVSGTASTIQALGFNGAPIPIITFPPDWNSEVALSIAHQTDTYEALDLSEERLRRRPRPLYGTGYSALLEDARQQGRLRKYFELAQAQPVGVPLWTEATRLTASANAGDSVLTCERIANTLIPSFSYVILWTDWLTWEIAAISSFSGSNLTLTAAVGNNWDAGTLVMPLPLGFARRPDFAGNSADVSSVPIEFEEVFNRGLNQRAAAFVEVVDTASDDFESYADANPVTATLNGGAGWSGRWHLTDESASSDDFESYSDADPVTATLNGGSQWNGPWSLFSYP